MNTSATSIPYGRQWIDDDDIQSVVETLRSDWLTTGPQRDRFEQCVAERAGVREGIAVSSGTAALHSAMYALDLGPGDEVILPPMTFVGTANAVVMQGATPVFADVNPDTLLIDPCSVQANISPRTKAIVAVDYAGQPCDYEVLRQIAERHGMALVADACHSFGASMNGKPVGSLADLTVFSFHPVKAVTTGEGGMVVTNDHALAEKIRQFRNHGVTTDHRQRSNAGTWYYEMVDLGWNYRLSDIHCALGLSQLKKLDRWIARRQSIADGYHDAFFPLSTVRPLTTHPHVTHAHHLYVLLLQGETGTLMRAEVFHRLRQQGIGVQVHYMPVYWHPYYQDRFGLKQGLCPNAEQAYERMFSLPIYPAMTAENVNRVIECVVETLDLCRDALAVPCGEGRQQAGSGE